MRDTFRTDVTSLTVLAQIANHSLENWVAYQILQVAHATQWQTPGHAPEPEACVGGGSRLLTALIIVVLVALPYTVYVLCDGLVSQYIGSPVEFNLQYFIFSHFLGK